MLNSSGWMRMALERVRHKKVRLIRPWCSKSARRAPCAAATPKWLCQDRCPPPLRETRLSQWVPRCSPCERPGSAIVRSPSDGLPAKLEERIPKAVSRIAQGLQVALLGANAGEMRKQEIKGVPLKKILFEPYEADVCRIFRHFLHLKDVEEDRTAANKERHRQRLVEWGKLEPDEPFQTDDEEISRDPLSRVSWATFFRWVEQEASFGVHPESRRACSALFRGARLWLRACASNAQRSEGLSLGLLLLWAYPTVSNRVVAELLAWIGAHELVP